MNWKVKLVFLVLSIFIVTMVATFLEGKIWQKFDLNKSTRYIQNDFSRLQDQSFRILDEVIAGLSKQGINLFLNEHFVDTKYNLYYEQGIILVIWSQNTVVYLSNNTLPIGKFNDNSIPAEGLAFVGNGWYYIQSETHGDFFVQSFLLIKKDYKYRNRFLISQFNDQFELPKDRISVVNDESRGIKIFNNDGSYAFSLVELEGSSKYLQKIQLWQTIAIIMIISGFLLIVLTVLYLGVIIIRNGQPVIGLIFVVVLLLAGRIAMFLTGYPSLIHEGSFFSATIYGTSHLLPSLGDFFVNIILCNIIFFFIYIHKESIFRLHRKVKRGISNFLILLLFVLVIAFNSYLIVGFIESLVIDSNLNLNINFIFDIDIYSLFGFAILAGLFFAHYFIAGTLSYIYHRYIYHQIGERNNLGLVLAVVPILIVMLVVSFKIGFSIAACVLFVFSVGVFLKFNKNNSQYPSFSHLIVSFLLFSLVATYTLAEYNYKKDISTRKNFALGLSTEQDPIAEYLFAELENELLNDQHLVNIVTENPYDKEKILGYLRSEYFNDFWFRYDIQVTTCAPGEELLFQPFEFFMECDVYFRQYIAQFGRPTISENFIYIENDSGRNSYIIVMPMYKLPDSISRFTLYLEFVSRLIPKELGFPELLIDERFDIDQTRDEYSYAVYKSGQLVTRFGSYPYSVNSQVYGVHSATFNLFEQYGYSHLLYNRDSETQIIISRPRSTTLQMLAPFSYLFILFVLISFMVWRTTLWLKGIKISWSVNFKKRVQISMISIVLVSVLAIGSSSVWFIFNIYDNKNRAIISEKAHSILIQLENDLADLSYLDNTHSIYLTEMLVSLSNIFFSDINLFHPEGVLLASSRQRLFDDALVSTLMNPIAKNQLRTFQKSLFMHNETIGNLDYLSVYIPLRNIDKQLIAYINLPYFAQQRELRSEISYFLVAFVNIYLLLLLITIILAFFISNYVSRPLQIIKASLSNVSLGRKNKKIEWSRNDEIGQLISEYNLMIDELAISAELLAKTERESAWREMAKQVAHEIKNPLTPMRLSVQYLSKALKDKPQDWEERLDRFSRTMVEQIDTLSFIASQFSDFARINVHINEAIDINKFLPEVLHLYRDFENVSLEFNGIDENIGSLVLIDKKQLLRVFNNLIKNAIQAYEKDEIARVIISCAQEDRYIKIVIKDYGMGIPENLKGNIFQPYFTTKSVGMGLGLALVKRIIDSYNGNISFESQRGEGSMFIIRLPLATGENRD